MDPPFEAGFSLALNEVSRVFENIPDWIEIVVGIVLTQVPSLWSRKAPRPRKRQRVRRRHIKLGRFEWRSDRRDSDHS